MAMPIVFALVLLLNVTLVSLVRSPAARLYDELGIRIPAITEAMLGTAPHAIWITLSILLLVVAAALGRKPVLREIAGSLGIACGGLYLAAVWLAFALPLVEVVEHLDTELQGESASQEAPP